MYREHTISSARMHNVDYISGSAAPKNTPKSNIRARENQKNARAIRNKTKNFSFVQFVIFAIAIIISGYTLVTYVNLHYNISSIEVEIASLENELNNKTRDNDEIQNRIDASIDLVEIEKIAIEELGMKHASAEQVIICEDMNSDFVRQVKDISEIALID